MGSRSLSRVGVLILGRLCVGAAVLEGSWYALLKGEKLYCGILGSTSPLLGEGSLSSWLPGVWEAESCSWP